MRDINSLSIKDERLAHVLEGKAHLLFDGAMGTMLQARGLLAASENPVLLNIEKPDAIAGIFREYVSAGAQVLTSNTFRANRLELEGASQVEVVFKAAYACANAASPSYIAAEIGPLGVLLEPYGDLEEDEAYDIFAEQVKAINQCNYDLILIETMQDLAEIKLAIRAACENSDLPIVACMSFGSGGKTMFGVSPEQAASVLSEAGASVVGMNCSVGPKDATDIACQMRAATDLPILIKPNAGLPTLNEGETVYDISPNEFAQDMKDVLDSGATIIGGCCGTTPDFIAELKKLLKSGGRYKI